MLLFASLRASARDATHAADAKLALVLPNLRDNRQRALDLAAHIRDARRAPSDEEVAEFTDLFYSTWDILSTLDSSHAASLPPLYPTENLKKEVFFAAAAMIAAECGQRCAASANAIYCGVRGTGKTTLLHATGAIAAVLLERMLPVWHDYEHAGYDNGVGAPSELMARALEAFYSAVEEHVPAHINTAMDVISMAGDAGPRALRGLAALQAAGHTPLLLLDEFAVLYSRSADSDTAAGAAATARGIAIMTAVHSLCKQGRDVVALLATSRTDVDGIIHPECTAQLPPARRLLGYPDLNNQVFIPRIVRPIRNAEQLAAYVQRRHGTTLAATAAGGGLTAGGLLHATGGCGRLIGQLLGSKDVGRFFSIDAILESAPLFSLSCALLSYAPVGLPHGGPWPAWGIPRKEAIDIVSAAMGSREAGGAGASSLEALLLVNGWLDSGIFYLNERGSVEALVPAMLSDLQARIDVTETLRRARVLVQTLQGFDGGSAGHSNESLLCEGAGTAMGLRHAGGNGGLLLLAANAGGGGFSARLGGDGAPCLLTIDDALGMLLRWRIGGHETGIDRLWLVRDARSGIIQVGLLQIKTGALRARLTAGRLETQRAHTKVSSVDDRTVAGILVKAERGIGELLPALASAFPKESFALDQFQLLSTKAATPAANSFREAYPSEADALHVALPTDQMRRLRAAVGAGEDGSVTLPWSVTDGLVWVRDVMPDTVRHLLAAID